MKILITGNSGYIGSHLTNLLNKKYSVYGLDICEPSIPVVEQYNRDIRYSPSFIDIEFDCVIHLAAKVSVNESVINPILYYDTNIDGTKNVLSCIRSKSFILASTGAAEYLSSPYAISKKVAEDIVKQYCMNYTIFRFYNVIGADCKSPTNPDGLMWNLINAKNTGTFNLYGTDYNTKDGSPIRDYVHVNEICHSIEKAINNPSNSIENLGHGEGYSVIEMVKLFKEVNNVDFKVNFCDRRDGDLEKSVLNSPSQYMTKLYNIKDYLKVV